MKTKHLILGSGIGGLAAGAALLRANEEDFLIVDGQDSLPLNLHNGVHYMHDVEELDLPFDFRWKKIPLTEQIWWPFKNKWSDTANLEDIVEYSKKAMGISQPNSIMTVGKTKEVWIPKSNNMNDLISRFDTYINKGHDKTLYKTWLEEVDIGKKIAFFRSGNETVQIEYENIISTVPLNKMIGICKKEPFTEFAFQTIFIRNYDVKGISPDWFINVYIPDPSVDYYRYSVLNKTLSVESTKKLTNESGWSHLSTMFDLSHTFTEYEWKTGKIVSIGRDERGRYIDEFSRHSIYLIGRFGLFNRKLLMHSTIKQANKVVKYLTNELTYDSLKEALLD